MELKRTAPETVEEKRRRTDAEIISYATAVAGTEDDLDPAWEAAAIESLLRECNASDC